MQLKVSYDATFDAENYLLALYDRAHLKHGRNNFYEDLLNSIESDEVKSLFKEEQDREEIKNKLVAILNHGFKREEDVIAKKIDNLKSAWSEVGGQVEFKLSSIYQKPFPFDEVQIYLSTFSLCPYSYKEKYIYLSLKSNPQNQIRTLLHELNHFMFYYYYSEVCKNLDKENFELLKESLTLFTNPEQRGKPNEKPLRELYIKQYSLSLDETVQIAIAFLMEQTLNIHN
ncbi:MAG: hypothetical protein WC766_01050 [Patescibacteria group bacterium]|jgi:hypothetical protein